jgi:ubiquitin-protein ligase E3 C
MVSSSSSVATEVVLVEQVKFLGAIFSPRRQEDVDGSVSLSSRIAALGYQEFLGLKHVQQLCAPLLNLTLEALQM